MQLPILALVLLVQSPAEADPIPSILERVSSERLAAEVERLAAFHTRHTFSDTESDTRGIGAARRWLRAQLEEVAAQPGSRLEVGEQRFERRVRRRGESALVEVVNLWGFLPGDAVDGKGRTYVVSGHYDSISGDFRDPEAYAPGADDDASGTAAVLELARAMARERFRANLVFLMVAGEEQGLWGSTAYAERCVDEGILVDGMVTNDIVGGIEGGNGVVDARTIRCFSGAEGLHSSSRELARSLREAAERYVPEASVRLVFRLDRFGRGGDHEPFHERGFPAVRLTEANEHYDRQHESVREEGGVRFGDLPEFVDEEYLARVTRVNGALLAQLALAPAPPVDVRLRGAVRYDAELSWEPAPDAAAYVVVWRETTAPTWEHASEPIPATEGRMTYIAEGVDADGHFFGVRALSGSGHASRTSLPARP